MAQTMHRCSVCGGRVAAATDDIILKFPKSCAAIEQALVGECQSCGELYLPAATSKRIDGRIAEMAERKRLTKTDRANLRILSVNDLVTAGGAELQKLTGALEALRQEVTALAPQ